MSQISDAFTALKAEVAASNGVEESAIASFKGLSVLVGNLTDTPTVGEIVALKDAIHSESANLAAAIVAVPGAPAPVAVAADAAPGDGGAAGLPPSAGGDAL